MSNLSEILESIISNTETSKIELADIPPHTRPGFEIAIRQAKDNLKTLRREYSDTILANAVMVPVNGNDEKVAEFSQTVENEGGLVLDAEQLYRELAGPCFDSLGFNKEFGPTQMSLLVMKLKAVAGHLGVVEMRGLSLPSTTVVNGYGNMINFVRDMIRNAVGDGINKMYLIRALTDKAIQIGYSEPANAPIALVNVGSNDEIDGLAPMFGVRMPTVTLTEEDEVTVDSVKASFSNKKKNNKSKNSPETEQQKEEV